MATAAVSAGCGSTLGGAAAVTKGDYDGAWRALSAYVQDQMREKGAVGVSLAIVDGDAVRSGGWGYSDRTAGIAADSRTLYRVGSVTKPIAATTLMSLVARGLVDLDQPIARYIPEFRLKRHEGGTSNATIRQIFSHHAGLPWNRVKGALNPRPPRFDSVVAELADEYATAPPDTIYGYSNLGFDLLGSVIERVTGKSFEGAVRDAVLAPAGMAEAGFDASRVGRSYEKGVEFPDWPMRDLPAGGLVAHADDLARFVRVALRRGALPEAEGGKRIMSERWWNEMWADQNAHVPLDLDFRIGFGWYFRGVEYPGAGFLARHSGNVARYRAELEILPERNLGVVVLSNSAEGAGVVFDVAKRGMNLWLSARGPQEGSAMPPAVDQTTILRRSEDAGSSEPLEFADLSRFAGTIALPVGTITARPLDGDRLTFDFWGTTWETVRRQGGKLGLQAKLWGLFPIDVPIARTFQPLIARVGGQEYLAIKRNGFYWIGQKLEPQPIPAAWRQTVGSYRQANLGDDYRVLERFSIRQEGDFLFLTSRYIFGDLQENKALRILSDSAAVTAGLGTGVGETVHRLAGDRLRYAGLELVKE
jgi:CubicO group peptidase (beta-lactamase class C family)